MEAQQKKDSHHHGMLHAMKKLGKKTGHKLGDLGLRPFRSKTYGDKHEKDRVHTERDEFEAKLNHLREGKHTTTKTLVSYEKIRVLGTGSFGRVLLVKEKDQKDCYKACKIISKKRIIETKQLEHTLDEKNILYCMDSRFVVKLSDFFQDSKNLYFILDFCNGGEMFTVIQRQKRRRFTEEQTRFFAAQTVSAFEYLHNLDVVHRDLKPENVLIDHLGNAKLMDFGFAKRVEDITYTMCGTPEYLAPEIIANKGYNRAVDWWAVGVLIYEMRCGRSPFEAKDQLVMFKKICQRNFQFPKDYTESEKELIGGLLQVDITRRLGYRHGGVTRIKALPYFKTIDFAKLYKGKLVSPFSPHVTGPGDARNFEKFPSEDRKPDDWLPGKDNYENLFAGF